MLKKSFLFGLGILLPLIGCQTNTNIGIDNQLIQQVNIQSTSGINSNTLQKWNSYVQQTLKGNDIQKGCEPFLETAKGSVKGNVMLFHGYSACPQQYQELSKVLSKNGFNVFVPLLPGHGKDLTMVRQKLTDDVSELPTSNNYRVYKDYAGKVSSILNDENQTNVVGGLSVGGVIAAQAMIQNPQTFKRGLLLAPFFNAASPNNVLIPTMGAIAPNAPIGWGKECIKQREKGRAGYCNFKMTHLTSVRKFGLETFNEINKIQIPVQISGVENDLAASNSYIGKARTKISNSTGCFFAKGATHSMLSRYDNLGIDMFWLNPLLNQINNFVVNGEFFNEVGKSDFGMSQCKSR